MKSFSIILFVSILLVGCNKEPGVGGTSSITGKVFKKEVNGLGEVLTEYYDPDRTVYILYGEDDNVYDDKFDTSFDGSYAQYLKINTARMGSQINEYEVQQSKLQNRKDDVLRFQRLK